MASAALRLAESFRPTSAEPSRASGWCAGPCEAQPASASTAASAAVASSERPGAHSVAGLREGLEVMEKCQWFLLK